MSLHDVFVVDVSVNAHVAALLLQRCHCHVNDNVSLLVVDVALPLVVDVAVGGQCCHLLLDHYCSSDVAMSTFCYGVILAQHSYNNVAA